MYFAIIPIKFGIIVITFIYKSLKNNNFAVGTGFILQKTLWNRVIMCSKHITNTLPWETDTLLNVKT